MSDSGSMRPKISASLSTHLGLGPADETGALCYTLEKFEYERLALANEQTGG